MSTPVLTFFNNKGGVGKTSLVYHLAWMYALQGKTVVAVDLDAQANLTGAFLRDDDIAKIWEGAAQGSTIYQAVKPLLEVKDIAEPVLRRIENNLYLLPGDVALSGFEDALSEQWPKSNDDKNLYRPMRILSAFWQVMQMAAKQVKADLILVDIGPNLGAINRSVLLATDFVVIPLGADLFSLQGLKNLGPTLNDWRKAWTRRKQNWQNSSESINYPDFELPTGQMKPIGYLCQQYGSIRENRPTQAYEKWLNKIPQTYRTAVLNQNDEPNIEQINDPLCLATIKHYRSLIPMAQEALKPVFKLTAADGAIGSHSAAVRSADNDFKTLANKIWDEMQNNLHPVGRSD